MSILTFNRIGVIRLFSHTIRCTQHRPTYGQLFEGRYRKDGADKTLDLPVAPEDADMTQVPAGLWLVKNQGVRLESNGISERDEQPVYAEGYGPDADWDAVREAAGGDDFVQFIPLDMAKLLTERNMAIELTETEVSVVRLDPETRDAIPPDVYQCPTCQAALAECADGSAWQCTGPDQHRFAKAEYSPTHIDAHTFTLAEAHPKQQPMDVRFWAKNHMAHAVVVNTRGTRAYTACGMQLPVEVDCTALPSERPTGTHACKRCGKSAWPEVRRATRHE